MTREELENEMLEMDTAEEINVTADDIPPETEQEMMEKLRIQAALIAQQEVLKLQQRKLKEQGNDGNGEQGIQGENVHVDGNVHDNDDNGEQGLQGENVDVDGNVHDNDDNGEQGLQGENVDVDGNVQQIMYLVGNEDPSISDGAQIVLECSESGQLFEFDENGQLIQYDQYDENDQSRDSGLSSLDSDGNQCELGGDQFVDIETEVGIGEEVVGYSHSDNEEWMVGEQTLTIHENDTIGEEDDLQTSVQISGSGVDHSYSENEKIG